MNFSLAKQGHYLLNFNKNSRVGLQKKYTVWLNLDFIHYFLNKNRKKNGLQISIDYKKLHMLESSYADQTQSISKNCLTEFVLYLLNSDIKASLSKILGCKWNICQYLIRLKFLSIDCLTKLVLYLLNFDKKLKKNFFVKK